MCPSHVLRHLVCVRGCPRTCTDPRFRRLGMSEARQARPPAASVHPERVVPKGAPVRPLALAPPTRPPSNGALCLRSYAPRPQSSPACLRRTPPEQAFWPSSIRRSRGDRLPLQSFRRTAAAGSKSPGIHPEPYDRTVARCTLAATEYRRVSAGRGEGREAYRRLPAEASQTPSQPLQPVCPPHTRSLSHIQPWSLPPRSSSRPPPSSVRSPCPRTRTPRAALASATLAAQTMGTTTRYIMLVVRHIMLGPDVVLSSGATVAAPSTTATAAPASTASSGPTSATSPPARAGTPDLHAPSPTTRSTTRARAEGLWPSTAGLPTRWSSTTFRRTTPATLAARSLAQSPRTGRRTTSTSTSRSTSRASRGRRRRSTST